MTDIRDTNAMNTIAEYDNHIEKLEQKYKALARISDMQEKKIKELEKLYHASLDLLAKPVNKQKQQIKELKDDVKALEKNIKYNAKVIAEQTKKILNKH